MCIKNFMFYICCGRVYVVVWKSRKFKEGLDGMFCKVVEYRACLHGACNSGSRLMFKFRSGTRGLMRNWVDKEEGRGERSTYCVTMMNVKVFVVFVGVFIVQLSKMCKLQEHCWD